MYVFDKRPRKSIRGIRQCQNTTRRWQHLPDELHTFARKFSRRTRHAGDIAAWAIEAFDEAGFDRIPGKSHDNRYMGRGPLRGLCRRRVPRDDQIDIELYQFRGQISQSRWLPVIGPEFIADTLTVDVIQ